MTINNSIMIQPDEQTKMRIKNLAIVGRAMAEGSNDNQYETNYFLANQALQDFSNAVERMELDASDKEGMLLLVQYLSKKIAKRMARSVNVDVSA